MYLFWVIVSITVCNSFRATFKCWDPYDETSSKRLVYIHVSNFEPVLADIVNSLQYTLYMLYSILTNIYIFPLL